MTLGLFPRERQMKEPSSTPGLFLFALTLSVAVTPLTLSIALSGQGNFEPRPADESPLMSGPVQPVFPSNDRDGNKITDYWTEEVAALYVGT